MDYVKNKVKKQYKNGQNRQHAKRNKNKDKGRGEMKGKEIIKDRDFGDD